MRPKLLLKKGVSSLHIDSIFRRYLQVHALGFAPFDKQRRLTGEQPHQDVPSISSFDDDLKLRNATTSLVVDPTRTHFISKYIGTKLRFQALRQQSALPVVEHNFFLSSSQGRLVSLAASTHALITPSSPSPHPAHLSCLSSAYY
jgi:hypothetical protein